MDARLQEEQDRAFNEEQRLRCEAAATAYAQNEAYAELADENAALRERVEDLEAEVEGLTAKLAKPYAYWSDMDEESARADPDEFRDYADAIGGAVPGMVFWCDPLIKLDREFYGIVPRKRPYVGEWTDGEYYGDTDLVGPFTTHEEAKEAAEGITKEAKEMYELRLQEND